MGAWMSRVWFLMFPAKEYKIVVVGLDNAGKTTTLYKLHLGEAVTAAPTIVCSESMAYHASGAVCFFL
uniref:Uncharacterized protein n=1 Tax=Aegilops tauschii subsp. strangulata TaxID=200361 RepID=A0A453HXG4_AEGTS